jgi:hypothetical protein
MQSTLTDNPHPHYHLLLGLFLAHACNVPLFLSQADAYGTQLGRSERLGKCVPASSQYKIFFRHKAGDSSSEHSTEQRVQYYLLDSYNTTQSVATYFDLQATTVRKARKAIRHKNKLATFVGLSVGN